MWSNITPSSPLWPQPRFSHITCTMVCNNQNIKMLLLGGYGDESVLSDCWLLDVMRGIGEKVRNRKGRNSIRLVINHWSDAIGHV